MNARIEFNNYILSHELRPITFRLQVYLAKLKLGFGQYLNGLFSKWLRKSLFSVYVKISGLLGIIDKADRDQAIKIKPELEALTTFLINLEESLIDILNPDDECLVLLNDILKALFKLNAEIHKKIFENEPIHSETEIIQKIQEINSGFIQNSLSK